jgi:hypothetical protein
MTGEEEGDWMPEPDLDPEKARRQEAVLRAVSSWRGLRSATRDLDGLGVPDGPPDDGEGQWARAYAAMTKDQKDEAADMIARWRERVLEAGGTWRPVGGAG